MPKKSKKKNTRANSQRKYVIAFVLIAIVTLGVVILSRLITTRANEASNAAAEATLAPETAASNGALPAEISSAQAAQMQSEGAFILDVRQPDEWEEGHIEGATLIPLDQLENRLNEIPKDSKVVVVCRSGNRSAQGRDLLLLNGFTQVTSMAGGMNAWLSAGLPVITGN